jgi:hypothetical protein
MLVTTHLIAGAAIGNLISNLPLSILLAIVSHYSLDLLPHLDQGIFKDNKKKFYFWAAIDFLVGGIVLYYIFKVFALDLNILLVVLAAILPDLIDSSPIISVYFHRIGIINRIYRFHEAIQRPGEKYIYSLGVLTQIIAIGVSLYLLIKY